MTDTIFRFLTQVITTVLKGACQMNMTHWSVAAAILVGVGVFCMQGLGSRKKY